MRFFHVTITVLSLVLGVQSLRAEETLTKQKQFEILYDVYVNAKTQVGHSDLAPRIRAFQILGGLGALEEEVTGDIPARNNQIEDIRVLAISTLKNEVKNPAQAYNEYLAIDSLMMAIKNAQKDLISLVNNPGKSDLVLVVTIEGLKGIADEAITPAGSVGNLKLTAQTLVNVVTGKSPEKISLVAVDSLEVIAKRNPGDSLEEISSKLNSLPTAKTRVMRRFVLAMAQVGNSIIDNTNLPKPEEKKQKLNEVVEILNYTAANVNDELIKEFSAQAIFEFTQLRKYEAIIAQNEPTTPSPANTTHEETTPTSVATVPGLYLGTSVPSALSHTNSAVSYSNATSSALLTLGALATGPYVPDEVKKNDPTGIKANSVRFPKTFNKNPPSADLGAAGANEAAGAVSPPEPPSSSN